MVKGSNSNDRAATLAKSLESKYMLAGRFRPVSAIPSTAKSILEFNSTTLHASSLLLITSPFPFTRIALLSAAIITFCCETLSTITVPYSASPSPWSPDVLGGSSSAGCPPMHTGTGPCSGEAAMLDFGTPWSHPAAGRIVVISIEISCSRSAEDEGRWSTIPKMNNPKKNQWSCAWISQSLAGILAVAPGVRQ